MHIKIFIAEKYDSQWKLFNEKKYYVRVKSIMEAKWKYMFKEKKEKT